MNKTIAALFTNLELNNQEAGSRTASLQQIYQDWNQLKVFTAERIKETDDVAQMLQVRVDSEIQYAARLEQIDFLQQK
jgi:Asp-tRNA(Asn)/Glu-tRNA(Gln) amidotransferase C subunit